MFSLTPEHLFQMRLNKRQLKMARLTDASLVTLLVLGACTESGAVLSVSPLRLGRLTLPVYGAEHLLVIGCDQDAARVLPILLCVAAI